MIDPEVRNRKISILQDNLHYLEKISLKKMEEFLSNFETKMTTRYLIQESAQICIDIAPIISIMPCLGASVPYKIKGLRCINAFLFISIKKICSIRERVLKFLKDSSRLKFKDFIYFRLKVKSILVNN